MNELSKDQFETPGTDPEQAPESTNTEADPMATVAARFSETDFKNPEEVAAALEAIRNAGKETPEAPEVAETPEVTEPADEGTVVETFALPETPAEVESSEAAIVAETPEGAEQAAVESDGSPEAREAQYEAQLANATSLEDIADALRSMADEDERYAVNPFTNIHVPSTVEYIENAEKDPTKLDFVYDPRIVNAIQRVLENAPEPQEVNDEPEATTEAVETPEPPADPQIAAETTPETSESVSAPTDTNENAPAQPATPEAATAKPTTPESPAPEQDAAETAESHEAHEQHFLKSLEDATTIEDIAQAFLTFTGDNRQFVTDRGFTVGVPSIASNIRMLSEDPKKIDNLYDDRLVDAAKRVLGTVEPQQSEVVAEAPAGPTASETAPSTEQTPLAAVAPAIEAQPASTVIAPEARREPAPEWMIYDENTSQDKILKELEDAPKPPSPILLSYDTGNPYDPGNIRKTIELGGADHEENLRTLRAAVQKGGRVVPSVAVEYLKKAHAAS